MKLAMILWLAHTLPQPVADPMCLATTVYLEARGQSEIGQRAIAEVILRRRDSGRWGDNVCAVVTAPGQFAMATLSPNQRLIEPAAGFTAARIALASSCDSRVRLGSRVSSSKCAWRSSRSRCARCSLMSEMTTTW